MLVFRAVLLAGFASACLLLPAAVSAQQASGIAGVIRDASGAVLPGVTVEAASPALIEKVRSVVSDGEGRYSIVDLRPGRYTVTFALAGFNTFRREGIDLPTGFTATVNADLQVGALEESITVSGAAPLVDTQNTRQQSVVSDDLLDALPSSTRGLATFATLIPGMAGTTDVGGSQGTYSSNSPRTNTYHGKSGVKLTYDGMRVNNMVGAGDSTGFMINPATGEETVIETGGVSAESPASGVSLNIVPKEGGNRFVFTTSGVYSNDNLQNDNLTDALRSRGLTTVNRVMYLYDGGANLGGPIRQDKLWFYTAHRFSGSQQQIAGLFWNKTQGTPLYTPDPDRPSDPYEKLRSHALRLTWQASARNKVNVFTDVQTNCTCGRTSFIAPEADIQRHFWPQGLFQATWSAPITSRLLADAGASATISHWPTSPTTSRITPDDISIVEQSLGLRYNAAATYNPVQDSDRYAQRFSLSYVTGSHAMKIGVQVEQGVRNTLTTVNRDVSYRFLNGVPNQITQFATPYLLKERVRADLGIYAQDRWTIGRLTLNYGLRFDYFNAYVPEQEVAAGQFVGARRFAAVHGVPRWKDLDPRLGAAFDIFGNGKTAVKGAVGRYLGVQGLAIAGANNPITTSVNSVTRTWTDTNANYIPDCDLRTLGANGECLAVSDQNFGGSNITTRYADDAIHGYGARDSFWDLSAELQHELTSGVSLTAGYYRNWAAHFLVTDNLVVQPADYSPYCITAPRDPRLPSGGGYQVCGLYDISVAKFGQADNLVTQASNYGEQRRVSDFVNLTFNASLKAGARLGGGIDTGRTVNDSCFVVDSPQQLLQCHVVTPFRANTQVKFFGSYPLPRGMLVSATFQNVAGPAIAAIYPATNAEIAASLGRNLASCGTRAICTATANVPLIEPNTEFEGRRTQIDLRLSKLFSLGQRLRLRANVDMYNALNASSILGIQTTYGSQWLRPVGDNNTSAILPGRLVQFSGQLTF